MKLIPAAMAYVGARPRLASIARRILGCSPRLKAKLGSYARHSALANTESNTESNTQPAGSPFYHYQATFDPLVVMRKHAVSGLTARAGYLTNFLGVVIDPKFFPTILAERAGEVEDIPIPANWHADIAEWGAALRAVDLASGTFTMIELGCGWGCWMNNSGVAARRAGLEVHVIGIEGDEGHVAFAHEALRANGFPDTAYTVYRGIAAPNPGTALFPRQKTSGVEWGLEPVFNATAEQRRLAVEAGSHDELPMIALDDVMAPYARIDLLHLDIQGGEADLIASCLPLITAKVAYLLVGSHSRQIEGRLFDVLLGAGWLLEIERSAILSVAGGIPVVTVDGVEGWRNPNLLPL